MLGIVPFEKKGHRIRGYTVPGCFWVFGVYIINTSFLSTNRGRSG